MLENFYNGKNVLITGHTGFKGSWLTLWLTKMGANVCGISLEPKSQKDLFVLSGVKDHITDYRQDIRNLEKVKEIFKKEKPEIIFHLAAQALVLEGYENPVSTYETNILGTVNILEAIRSTKSVRSAVMISSDKCYENKEWEWGYRENDPIGGFDPYSSSKGASEIVIQSFRNSFFNKRNLCGIASARAGNVIGGGDWAENRIIPDCVRAFEKGEVVNLRTPEATRPWQHVLEPIRGYMMLAKLLFKNPQKYAEAWNFGPNLDNQKNVKQLVQCFVKHYNSGEFNYDRSPKKHEAGFLALDISKAINKLCWQPVLDFDKTVHITADWYQHYNEQNVLAFTVNQIEEYIKIWKLRKEK